MSKLSIPISDEDIRNLRVGDTVDLNGVILTGRDAAHKYFVDELMSGTVVEEEKEVYEKLKEKLKGGIIYHCGPVVKKLNGKYAFLAAGPTTSIREEPYQGKVIAHFGIKGVIGKGGMGESTLRALEQNNAVYLHAVGGAASLIAKQIKDVETVYKLEFGVPEAIWQIRVEDFTCVVTMDSHGNSLHKEIDEKSRKALEELL